MERKIKKDIQTYPLTQVRGRGERESEREKVRKKDGEKDKEIYKNVPSSGAGEREIGYKKRVRGRKIERKRKTKDKN